MKIESIFTGMPVYHKDGGPNMTVQRCWLQVMFCVSALNWMAERLSKFFGRQN